ncbi:MAG TPA: LamG domain-containing protein [Roseimicrobium sp.]|nr:LamG domain-containing protein [Roseimicrobium sp.]
MVALATLLVGLMAPPQAHALKCANLGDGVRVPNSAVLEVDGDLTLEAWIKPESVDLGGPFHFIVSKNYVGTGFALVLIGKGDNVRLQFETNDTVAYFVPMRTLRSKWWHVAGVYRAGKDVALYVNGLEVARKPAPSGMKPNELPLWIGASPWDQFIGSIADVRVWSVARNSNQIFTDKDRRLKGNEPGLVANWTFRPSSSGKTYDITHHTKPGEVLGRAALIRRARK